MEQVTKYYFRKLILSQLFVICFLFFLTQIGYSIKISGDEFHPVKESYYEKIKHDRDARAGLSTDNIESTHPFNARSREHLEHILNLDEDIDETELYYAQTVRKKLQYIYEEGVKKLEDAYKFKEISRREIGAGEINSDPRILFLGPWSTGKSSMINYLLGLENSSRALPSGAQPTTHEFTILSYGPTYKTIDGMVLTMDPAYAPLSIFGRSFVERLLGVQVPHKLLRRLTLIDTPGIIENKKQQERGYPYYDVCQWFIERADLIFLVFDPSKLDIGTEIESLFQQLKGRESKIRFILNKADTVTPQELMRVYGALLWSLAPLINVTEPPRMYVGSFWSRSFRTKINKELFIREEMSLINDIYGAMTNQLENKVALIRQHAIMVRNHALVVDRYLAAFKENAPILFGSYDELMKTIAENPDNYKIFQRAMSSDKIISKRDMRPPSDYEKFFKVYPISSFQPLSAHCGYISKCLIDKAQKVITEDLPKLIEDLTNRRASCIRRGRRCGGRSRDLESVKERYQFGSYSQHTK